MKNKSKELVCCDRCGRDTANTNRLCSWCLGTGPSEHKGRKVRKTFISQTSFDEVDPQEGEGLRTAVEYYHGETLRDDL